MSHEYDYHLLLDEQTDQIFAMTDPIAERVRKLATASLLEVWIDETERRLWFLFETARRPDSGGH
jgi:DNA-binding ferritin-like protein